MRVTKHVSSWTVVAGLAVFGLFLGTVRDGRAADPSDSQQGPVIKNLRSLTYRAAATPAPAPRGLTRKEVEKLTAAATREDHLKLAEYYRTEADRLNAEAAAYDQALALYRDGHIVKNLMAPNTRARYEYIASGLRDEAKSHAAVAAAHEQMAKDATVKIK